jgi:glutamyl-tRNA reductase
MKTSLTLFGINHRTTPLHLREKCSLSNGEIRAELQRVSMLPFIKGCVILFTCNRTEYYFTCSEKPEPVPSVYFPESHMFAHGAENHLYTKENTDALCHLFRVAAGLDSQVLGENEVLFQVKEAYRISQEMHCLGKELHKIFEQSFRVGRKVRRETAISKGNISIASLAIKLLEKKCGLAGKTVMLIGINKIIGQIAQYLLEHTIHTAFVGNRTFEKAVELARMLGGEAVHLDNLNQLMEDIDIIITATSAPHFIIKKEKVLAALDKRTKPVYIIDLAVPRDVDPELQHHQQVCLYNLEEIQPLVETSIINKQQEAQKAEHLVRESVQGFAAQIF